MKPPEEPFAFDFGAAAPVEPFAPPPMRPGRLNAQYMPATMRPKPTTPRAIQATAWLTIEIAKIVAARPRSATRMPTTKRFAENPGPLTAAWVSEMLRANRGVFGAPLLQLIEKRCS